MDGMKSHAAAGAAIGATGAATGSAAIRGKRDGALLFGGVAALLVAALSLVDVAVGTMTGGDLGALLQSAAGRFAQLADSPLLGLYNLDLLNLVTTLFFLPALHAVYTRLRGEGSKLAGLAWGLSLVGAAVFAANNPALPMLGLARAWIAAGDEAARTALAAAGEAVLARGAHGGPGVFPSFLLPLLANLALSGAMLRGRSFKPLVAWLGLAGNALLVAYLVLVTFVPGVDAVATAVAAPGGLMSIAWMVTVGVALLRAGKLDRAEAYKRMAEEVAERAQWSDWDGTAGDGLER